MITAIVFVNAEVSTIPEVAARIADFLEGVSEVYSVTGQIDLIVMVRVRSHEDIALVVADHLNKVPGVTATETHIAFRSHSRHDLDAAFSLGLDYDAVPAPAGSPPEGRPAEVRRSRLLLATGAVALGSWVASAFVMSSRGIDLTDESFYLLSYRWWDSNPRTFSGAQYLYGPVFELLGFAVPALRLARLLLLLSAHGAFVLALRDHLRDTGRPPWAWGAPTMVLTFATGGISYGWLPQAPGYNDVALLGSLLLGASVLRCATAQTRGSRLPLPSVLVAGAAIAAVALAEWPSALALGALTVVVLIGLLGRTPARLAQAAAAGLLGVALFAVMFHVAVAPWDEVLPPMREVNRLVSQDTNSPAALLSLYATSTFWVLTSAALCAGAGVLPALAVRHLARTTSAIGRRTGEATTACAAPLAAALPWLVTPGLPRGGAGAAWTYTVSILAALMTAALVARARRDTAARTSAPQRPGLRSTWPVVLLLVGMPAAQAFGTGNALYLLAIHGLVFWVAAVVVVLADSGHADAPVVMTSAVTTCAVLVAVVGELAALLLHPYRSDGIGQASVTVAGSDNLSGLAVNRRLGEQLEALSTAVDQRALVDSPVYAVDELAGLVLALDRRPAGEAWNSRLDPGRAAAGLRAYCTDVPDAPPPVIIADRPLGQSEVETLQACGWPPYAAYDAFAPPEGPEGVRVFVPDSEEVSR